jgi:hypothetical protein
MTAYAATLAPAFLGFIAEVRTGGRAALEREPGRPRVNQPELSAAELWVAELERGDRTTAGNSRWQIGGI